MFYAIFNTEGIQPQQMETKESNLNSGISRKKAAQERKAAAKRERDKAYYQQNKAKKIAQVKERRKKLQAEKSIRPHTRSIAEKNKRQHAGAQKASRIAAQEKREKTRQQTRERVRKYREKKRTEAQEFNNSVDSPGFANRTSKKRAIDKVKKTLPSTPRKKAEIVQSIVKSC